MSPNINLKQLYRKVVPKTLKLYWWRYEYPDRVNFGDEITPALISKMFGHKCKWSAPNECDIAGAGSIIELLLKNKGSNKPTLWGSGFIKQGNSIISANDFNVAGLRGNSSLKRFANGDASGISLGDPGLLADQLLENKPIKKYRLGVIPHYVDVGSHAVEELSKRDGVKIIDVLDTPENVTRDIAQCEAVISSSLHGLIVADSVGTPNAHIQLSNKLTGGLYKFKDYYSVYPGPSRHILLHPKDINCREAKKITKLVKERFKSPTNINSLKQGLIDSFPY